MSETIERTRTFALIGHGGSGKTSLAESFLFAAGLSKRLGRVDDGNSVFDSEPEEINRKVTISASYHDLTWKKHQLYLADTPGDDNFLNDSRASLQGVDGCVLVGDAVDGIKVQGEKAWSFAKDFGLPGLAIINKMDRERADFASAVEKLASNLDTTVVPICLPIGKEAAFSGLVDVLNEKAYTWTDDGSGKMTAGDVPDDMADDAAEAKEQLIEAIAEADDSLLERYLEGEELSKEELAAGLRAAVLQGVFLPVIPAAAGKNMCAQTVLDVIVDAIPSPLDRPAMSGLNGEQEISVSPDADAPFVGLVFKTVADPFAGRLSMIRVFQGTLTPDSNVYNATKMSKERFGPLFVPRGKDQQNIEQALPGAIVAVAKLKDTVTGDTLCAEKPGLVLSFPDPLPPVISYACSPKEKGDEEKTYAAINRLVEEDESLSLQRDARTGDMLLSGMGQVHIETTLDKLKRKFGGEVVLETPKVPYLETIRKKVTGIQGKYKKQSGGRGQYGDAVIDMEPTPQGEGYVFDDKIVGGVIPRQFIPAVDKGIAERCLQGVLAGYQMVDFKVSLIFGSYHSVDSSEMAFKVAGSMAFQKAAAAASPTILEPIMNMEVICPEDAMGDVMGDLNSRRGKVLGMDAKGSSQVIKALVPLAEVLRYAPDLTSMTGGRGAFTMTHDHYEEVPAMLQDKVIEQAKQDAEEE